MKKVGLTGGIGSGKSFVAKIFQELGVPVYNSDERAKLLMRDSVFIKKSLQSRFGAEVYRDGDLNRTYLASLIFGDQTNMDFVNGLVHPEVARDFKHWAKVQDSKYVLKEAAILFEVGGEKSLDKTILVTASIDVQIERVKNRNGWSEVEIRSRMSKQWSTEQKEALADFCIVNDGNSMLLDQILNIHSRLSEGL